MAEEKTCVGCVQEQHEVPGVTEWIPDPTCPVHGDPTVLTQGAAEAVRRPVIEGTVMEKSLDTDQEVTVAELIVRLTRFVAEHPEAAAMPVAFDTHCCVQMLVDADPTIEEGGLRLKRPFVLLYGGENP